MIPISKPIIAKNAQKYLLECLESGWVSSKGPFVDKFESEFAKYIGTKYAVACSSGTSAIHLALSALNVGPGDEVIVPTLTMIAAALPVIYAGATPVLVDVEEDTGNIDPQKIEGKITKKTRAIIAVHINGHPVDMDPLLSLKRKYHLPVIEDAAEAHGAEYQMSDSKWRKVGNIGDLGCFSFYGNKVITTGEGGMVVTNNRKLAERVRSLRNLARSKNKHFYHKQVAFAYRMSGLQASLGVAQLEQAVRITNIKRQLAQIYMDQLEIIPHIKLPIQKVHSKRIYWNFDILLRNNLERDKLSIYLLKKGIETRHFVIPLHKQPAFLNIGLFHGEKYPVADNISSRGLSLPLGPSIKRAEVNFICQSIINFFK